mgnify:CR=1 FL=1
MKKIIYLMFLLITILITVNFAFSVPFTPQGNIDLKYTYSVIHAKNVSATYLYGNGSYLYGIKASGVTNETDPIFTANKTSIWNAILERLKIKDVNHSIDSRENNWTKLQNYPITCPAGSAITSLGDSVICTAFALSNYSNPQQVNTSLLAKIQGLNQSILNKGYQTSTQVNNSIQLLNNSLVWIIQYNDVMLRIYIQNLNDSLTGKINNKLNITDQRYNDTTKGYQTSAQVNVSIQKLNSSLLAIIQGTNVSLLNNIQGLNSSLLIKINRKLENNTNVKFTSIQNTNYIQFNISYNDTNAEGKLKWNSDDGTLEYGLPGGNVNLQLGQEELIRVYNEEGFTIGNGKVVYASSATGNIKKVKVANNNNHSQALRVVGVATEDIEPNHFGYITTVGLVRDINTIGFIGGQLAYLGMNGSITTTKPIASNTSVVIGIVVRPHATEGILYTRIRVIPYLTELSDVYCNNIINNSYLKYNSKYNRFECSINANFNNITANFIQSQPITGKLGSGIIYSNNISNRYASVNVECTGLVCKYPKMVFYLVKSDNSVKTCNITNGTITLDNNAHNVVYVDNNCAIQKTTFANYIESDLAPGGTSDFFNAVVHSNSVEVQKGITLGNKVETATRKLLLQTLHLDVISGLGISTNTFPKFTIASGEYVYLRSVVDFSLRNTSLHEIEFVGHNTSNSWKFIDHTGINLTHLDNGTTIVKCTNPTRYRRYYIFALGFNNSVERSELHQLAALDNVNYASVANCLDTVTTPLTYTLPDYYNDAAVMLYAYCGRASDSSWTTNFIDLRTVKSSGTSSGGIDISVFVPYVGATSTVNLGNYNVSARYFIGNGSLLTGLQKYNDSNKIQGLNSSLLIKINTKSGTGTCLSGYAVQNTTTSGVECVQLTTTSSDNYWNLTGKNLTTKSTTYNVGIGTKTPTANLHIFQRSATANQILFKVNTSEKQSFVVDEDGDVSVAGTITGAFSGSLSGSSVTAATLSSSGDIYTTGSGDDLWLGTSTQANSNFRAYATGNLITFGKTGIGNATMPTKLYVQGNASIATKLFIGTKGDYDSSATVLAYGDYDSYLNQTSISEANDRYPGLSISTSRGSGSSPAINVQGDIIGGIRFFANNKTSAVKPSPYYLSVANIKAKVISNSTGIGNMGGELSFATKQNGTSGLPVTRLTIKDNGNITINKSLNILSNLLITNRVGIGTLTPSAKLSVNGNITATKIITPTLYTNTIRELGGFGKIFEYVDDGGDTSQFYIGTFNTTMQTSGSANGIDLNITLNNGTHKFQILYVDDNNRRMMIGSGTNPNAKLHVNGNMTVSQNVTLSKSLILETNQKVCLNGIACTRYIKYNSTHIVSYNGSHFKVI